MNRTKVLETILVLVLALGVLFWFTKNPWLLLAAAILGVIGLILPGLAWQIHWGWMKLGEGIGFVMSRVILTLIFFIVLVPVAFLSRLAGKKTITMKPDGKYYFKDRNVTYTKESMENVW